MIKIFNHYFHRHTLLQVAFDSGLIISAIMLWLILDARMSTAGTSPLLEGLGRAVLVAAGILTVHSALGFYERSCPFSRGQLQARAVLALLLSALIGFVVFSLLPLAAEHGGMAALLVLSAASTVTLAPRVLLGPMLPAALTRQRVLIYGTGARAHSVSQSLLASDPHVDLVGYFASPNETEPEVSGRNILCGGHRLAEVVRELAVDEIVVALSERRGGSMPMRELLDCKLFGVRVMDIAAYFEKNLGQIRLDALSAGYLIFGEGFNQGFVRTTVKRLFDLLCALVLILLASPLMLLATVAIMLESSGPILYRQERVGLNGRIINVVKFRSMRTDAEKDGVPKWATVGDCRITRVGRVLRKLRIDELPQLFSVVKGDMSLVGPRPERPFFVDQLTQQIPFYAVRHSVKPGVTGWAQVRYQYGSSVSDTTEKLQYDLYYVKNHTLFLDLVVLFETIGVVLTGKGAQ